MTDHDFPVGQMTKNLLRDIESAKLEFTAPTAILIW